MNLYDDTSSSDLLMDFLEGELDPTKEELLFSKLTHNANLRLEMKELLAVNRLVQLDAESMLLPSSWKGEVTSTIALVQRQEPTHNDKKKSLIGTAWWQGSAIALLSLCIGVLGTLGIQKALNNQLYTNKRSLTIPLYHSADQTTSNSTETSTETTRERPPHVLHSKNTPFHNTQLYNHGISTVERERSINSLSKASPEASSTLEKPTDQRLSLLQPLSETTVPLQMFEGNKRSSVLPSLEPLKLISKAEPVSALIEDKRLEVSTRTTFRLSESDVSTVEQNTAPLRNLGISLSLLYHLNHHHQLGVTLGRERTPQIFRGVEQDERVRYEQSPTLNWIGATYQFTGTDIIDGIHPLIQGTVGGTSTGPIGKLMIAGRYRPESRISLTAGLEGTSSLYQFQEEWFSSETLDFIYGISIAF